MLRCRFSILKKLYVLALTAVLLALPALARDNGQSSWQNVARLSTGQKIEVDRRNGGPLEGALVSVLDQAINLRTDQREVVIPRADVTRIRLRSTGHKVLWIGLAAGAGAGAGIGAGAGAGLANESGGDFEGLKPVVIGAWTAAGALVGLAIGSIIEGRRNTIYRRQR